jgi:glyoxylase I family protein
MSGAEVQIQGIHHLCLKASSPAEWQQVQDFYIGLLGLSIKRQWDGGMMLDAGNALLELFCNGESPLPQGAIRHLALAVEDVDGCVAAVRQAGYPITVEPKDVTLPSQPPLLIRVAFCRGPLGEEIEFFHEKRTKFFGTMLCPDCVAAQRTMEERGLDLNYIDISASTANLKAFLRLRDTRPEFEAVKAKGGIGIPCFLREDGSLTFDVNDL